MQFEWVNRHYRPDRGLRAEIEDRLEKLARVLSAPVEARVILEKEKHRESADLHVAHRHGVLQARAEGDAMREALRQAFDTLQEQARRSRKKTLDRRRRPPRQNGQTPHWPVDVVEKGSLEGGGVRVIRSSLLRIKPMTVEEASLELENSEHDFVAFRDGATQRVNVLFRRKDGHYGLIAPEF
jgi:putative sigma-54 modulation protein